MFKNQMEKYQQQPHVSPEHILLGLLKEGEGVGAIVLKKLGVDLKKMQEAIKAGA